MQSGDVLGQKDTTLILSVVKKTVFLICSPHQILIIKIEIPSEKTHTVLLKSSANGDPSLHSGIICNSKLKNKCEINASWLPGNSSQF